MIRSVTILTLIMLLFSIKLASADFYEDCVRDCSSAQAQCVEGITLYDATGVQEAKDVCAAEMRGCKEKCHVEDAKTSDELKREAEDAEKKRQEQEQETVNGQIKVFDFNK